MFTILLIRCWKGNKLGWFNTNW